MLKQTELRAHLEFLSADSKREMLLIYLSKERVQQYLSAHKFNNHKIKKHNKVSLVYDGLHKYSS